MQNHDEKNSLWFKSIGDQNNLPEGFLKVNFTQYNVPWRIRLQKVKVRPVHVWVPIAQALRGLHILLH